MAGIVYKEYKQCLLMGRNQLDVYLISASETLN